MKPIINTDFNRYTLYQAREEKIFKGNFNYILTFTTSLCINLYR